MALTRIQIVNLSLDQAGLDLSFQTKGRGWLNFITQKLSLRLNNKFYYKQVDITFIPNQTRYALPADFQRADNFFFIDSNGNQGRGIYLCESYQFNTTILNGSGFPQFVTIDEDREEIVFNSAPNAVQSQGFRLFYFRSPAILSTNSTDDNVIPDYKDQSTLVEEIKLMAFEFIDDERAQGQEMKSLKSQQGYQRLQSQVDGNSKMDLNNWVFRGNRRGKNRTGGGWV